MLYLALYIKLHGLRTGYHYVYDGSSLHDAALGFRFLIRIWCTVWHQSEQDVSTMNKKTMLAGKTARSNQRRSDVLLRLRNRSISGFSNNDHQGHQWRFGCMTLQGGCRLQKDVYAVDFALANLKQKRKEHRYPISCIDHMSSTCATTFLVFVITVTKTVFWLHIYHCQDVLCAQRFHVSRPVTQACFLNHWVFP